MSEEEILDEIKKCDHDDKKTFGQNEKAKKGWMFSVFFLCFVIIMILFLCFIPINQDNRDVIIGMIGTITGSIGSMIAIASGRDPSEIEDLKESLAKSDADRQALISRLRDAQIQLQILRDQITDLQSAMISELSILSGKNIGTKKTEEEVVLHKDVKDWLGK